MPDLGQIAYEAYCAQTGWRSLISGAPLPPFAELKTEIQKAWRASAQAVQDTVSPSTPWKTVYVLRFDGTKPAEEHCHIRHDPEIWYKVLCGTVIYGWSNYNQDEKPIGPVCPACAEALRARQ
jgi:hypothetical protein